MKKQNLDLNRFDPAPIDALKTLSGGKMYGLPVLNNVMVMYYNKDLFDKFGVSYPKDGMTWDDVLVLAQKLTRTEQGKPYLGLVVSPSHYIRMNQFSMPLVDVKTNKSTASNDIWKRIYQTVFIAPAANSTYQDWINDNKNQLPAKKQFLKDKNLAMFIQLSQLFNAQSEMETMNWDMVSLPVFKDRPGVGSQVYPTYLNITSISKYKDQAMEAIHYLTSEEHQMERSRQGDMTILKDGAIQSALGTATRFKNINFKAVNSNKVSPASPKSLYDDVVQEEFEKVLPDVSTGLMDINTALRTVQDVADKAIAAKK
jgi:multiple sugar transport system substrate-binding protein